MQQTLDPYRVFGERLPDAVYLDRPGAYLIAEQNGRIAVIQTPKGSFLPGGGLENGECDEACIRREILEEVGCTALIEAFLCAAETYTTHDKLGPFHPIQYYYSGRLGDKICEPQEQDHELLFLPPEKALGKLFPEMQNWAVEEYLRKKNGTIYNHPDRP